MDGQDRHVVKIGEACQIVGVSRRTIYNWLHTGKVEYKRTPSGAIRIYEDTLWRGKDHMVSERQAWGTASSQVRQAKRQAAKVEATKVSNPTSRGGNAEWQALGDEDRG